MCLERPCFGPTSLLPENTKVTLALLHGGAPQGSRSALQIAAQTQQQLCRFCAIQVHSEMQWRAALCSHCWGWHWDREFRQQSNQITQKDHLLSGSIKLSDLRDAGMHK